MPRLFLVRFWMILGDFRPGLLNTVVGKIYTACGIMDRLRNIKTASLWHRKRPKGCDSSQGSPFATRLGQPDLSAAPDLLVSSEHSRGNPEKGRNLFLTNCAACHGKDGQGQSGPKLKNRLITDAVFWSTAKNGKRLMPAFSAILSTRDLEHIREWLQH